MTFLAMPGYGSVTAGAGRGFWLASRKPHRIVYRYNEGSLLAQNFNLLWAEMLNLRAQGEQVDYFAMQHADIEPQDYWLDMARAELDARGLDVLGVAVPIKDHHGLTSIALADDKADNFKVHCRLTLSEVYRLPETFTSEDVGRPLLINTGLWICRLGPWSEQVYFTINDRIVYDLKAKKYVPQVEPEDWFFSRLCHELKLKIGVTRKIRVAHAGQMRFLNSFAWGDPHDKFWVNESQIPNQPDDDLRFPEDVQGWLTETEGRALARLARDRRVLEIGSFCGRSTICMAQTAKQVVAVDPFDGRDTPKPGDTWDQFTLNLTRYGVADKVRPVVSTTADLSVSDGPFDVAFIDGAHDYESVKLDAQIAMGLLAGDGLLAFHDYREEPGDHDGRWDPGVTQAVNELLQAGGELVSLSGTVAVVRPPALVPLEAAA